MVGASPRAPGTSLGPCPVPGRVQLPHMPFGIAHPPGSGVLETPSALGTADNPSAPTGTPLIIT